jgi:hypothetical protein
LAGDQWIDLALVVFIVGKALIDLGARKGREARDHRLDRGSSFKHRHDVMHANAGTLHHSMAGSDPRPLNNISVTRRNHSRTVAVDRPVFKRLESLDRAQSAFIKSNELF